MSLPDTDVAVIGAGTYGVSVALALQAHGVETRLYGRPFTLWLRHTLPTFSLRSDSQASGVHGGDPRFSFRAWLRTEVPRGHVGRWLMRRIPGPMFRRYLRWVADEIPVRPVRDLVTALSRAGDAFRLETAGGEAITARRVVIATGIRNHVHVARALRPLGDRVAHSWDAEAVARIEQRRVLVVGGGQSAAEACLHLAPRNRVTWVHRSPIDYFNEPIGLPTPAYNGAYVLSNQLRRLPVSARVALGRQFTKPTVVPALRHRLGRLPVRRVRADAKALGLARANGTVRAHALQETFDRVVACTGYRIGLRSLPFLSDHLQDALATPFDQPELDAGFRTRVPGLHVVGGLAEYAHGAPQRFMFGSRAAAAGVVRAMVP